MKKECGLSPRGQTLVEFAVLFPLFVMIVFFILDFGRAIYYFSVIQNAAREGTRYGIVSPNDTSGIVAQVKSFAVGLDPNDITVTPTQPDDYTIRVQVNYIFSPVTPIVSSFLSSGQILIHSQSTMRIEK